MSFIRPSRKTVAIEVVDGGWVLDWADPAIDEDHLDRLNQQWPRPKAPKSSGREIFTDRKKLLKRIEGFLS